MIPPYANRSDGGTSCLHFLLAGAMALLAISLLPGEGWAQDGDRRWRAEVDTIPTLGLDSGFLERSTSRFDLKFVTASQTIAALEPAGTDSFDFTPADWLERLPAWSALIHYALYYSCCIELVLTGCQANMR